MTVDDPTDQNNNKKNGVVSVGRGTRQSPPRSQGTEKHEGIYNNASALQNGCGKPNYSPRSLMKSDTISASKCIGDKGNNFEVCDIKIEVANR